MKRINKTKLGLKTETIRALADASLENAAGGITGLRCESIITVCGYCNSWGPCSLRSKFESFC